MRLFNLGSLLERSAIEILHTDEDGGGGDAKRPSSKPADGRAEEAARALAHPRHLLLLHLPRVRSQFGGG
jgi:hypothetical protein